MNEFFIKEKLLGTIKNKWNNKNKKKNGHFDTFFLLFYFSILLRARGVQEFGWKINKERPHGYLTSSTIPAGGQQHIYKNYYNKKKKMEKMDVVFSVV